MLRHSLDVVIGHVLLCRLLLHEVQKLDCEVRAMLQIYNERHGVSATFKLFLEAFAFLEDLAGIALLQAPVAVMMLMIRKRIIKATHTKTQQRARPALQQPLQQSP